MRDKHAVEKYKAGIKEKLTRAGLIRGQPRTSLVRSRTMASTQPHPRRYTRDSTSDAASIDSRDRAIPYRYAPMEDTYRNMNTVFPAMPVASTPFTAHTNASHPYYPYSVAPSALQSDPYCFSASEQTVQDTESLSLSSTAIPFQASPSLEHSLHEHVFYYFAHMRSLQPMLVGTELANATYSLITQNPKGAVTNAVCALSSLHLVQAGILRGLDSPESSMEQSKATYFREEAYFQINSSRQLHGTYTESDAIAALHLVSFSQLSGGQVPWQDAFAVLCDWLIQTTLPSAENPCVVYNNMSTMSQYIVKATISLDIFSSLMMSQSPRFLILIKRLLGNDCRFWSHDNDTRKIQMEDFAGLPNNIMLGIAEISALSHWKAVESSKGSLSYRELVRRGDVIEQLLREQPFAADIRKEQTEPSKVPAIEIGEEIRGILVDVFREAALQYLYTIISGCNPGVPEIKTSVDAVVQSLCRLQPSANDRNAVFPIFISAYLTNDRHQREFLKNRLQMPDSYFGNIPHICMVLEAVWRARDAGGGGADIREILKDFNLALLLV
ncbi:hypothetical protein APHAL10511_004504 [Amanita phalloides]|nr:hypothetical protein APHAL10511_004504 [Amanita phalloides]